jgi:hypothetical protein
MVRRLLTVDVMAREIVDLAHAAVAQMYERGPLHHYRRLPVSCIDARLRYMYHSWVSAWLACCVSPYSC